jgi:hypothetical protein
MASFVVREIERAFPGRSIGRSLLQKLFFIMSRDGLIDIPFDLFINGPYSDWVESALNHAMELGMLTVQKEDGRSSISARGGLSGDVPQAFRERARCSVLAYGFHEEGDLAILTTALFLDQRGHGQDELIRVVIMVNPRFDLRRVCSLLDPSDVVYRSW